MKLSVLIPSRKERFLARTVEEILAKARGDVEVIAVLDGYWPTPPLPEDKRLVQLHLGKWQGMRPGINAAAAIAKGDFLMKLDGHCALAEGFDVELARHCEDGWLVVPRRYSLRVDWSNPEGEKLGVRPDIWELDRTRPTVDAHYLSWPFARAGDKTCGLHGNVWAERAKARAEVTIDDEMSSQGSCWFTSKKWWLRMLEPMEVHRYGTFAQEFQEIGNKTWLGGGRVVVNKGTWYAHLHKGRRFGTGYGFSNEQWDTWAVEREAARITTIRHWLGNKWHARVRDFSWLIERFWPVPGWPKDWERQTVEGLKTLAPLPTGWPK